jgi:hypothetical protein
MQFLMTNGTQRDQVLLGIVSRLAAEFLMMDLKIIETAARLTSPAVPVQDLATELLVGSGRKSPARMFWWDCVHEARFACDKNACFCSQERNLKYLLRECSSI